MSYPFSVSNLPILAVVAAAAIGSAVTSPGAAILAVQAAGEAELEFNYLPIANVRTDPIINQECLSDHVHTFYGPPLVAPSVTTDDLIASKPEDHSGLVEENKSLYWHPSIYRVSSDGVYTLDEIHYSSVYYFWDTGKNKKTHAFPKGFRMIASDREAFTECVVGNFKPCTRTDDCNIPEGVDKTFFPAEACDMLEITMDFPSCWDGRIDSDNHRDHVVYRKDDDDSCPKSHKKEIPTLSISIYIKNYDGGYHTWSDMSDKFHTDYLSGWDVDVMESFLEGCKKNTDECHRFLTWKEGGPTGCDTHDEKHEKLVSVLPPLPNTRETIADEPVTNIKSLPRGECLGPFPDGDGDNDGIPPAPTPNPVTFPTASPVEAPEPEDDDENDDEVCADDGSFRYKKKGDKNCRWVGKKPGKRCDLKWKKRELRSYCPEACDECDQEDDEEGGGGGGGNETCRDDADFRYDNEDSKDCNWVGKKAGKRCRLKWKNFKLRTYCPEACDECE